MQCRVYSIEVDARRLNILDGRYSKTATFLGLATKHAHSRKVTAGSTENPFW